MFIIKELLFNLIGEIIEQQEIVPTADSDVAMDISAIPSGSYFAIIIAALPWCDNETFLLGRKKRVNKIFS